MKIVIPGGSGQVGRMLARAFTANGDDVTILSRRAGVSECRIITWDGKTLGAWTDELDGSDLVINLAGRSVNCRYNATNRREILNSRIDSTRAIGEAIRNASNPPAVWLQASTATIYAHRFDAANDEATGILGGSEPRTPETWKFSIDVATSWEEAALSYNLPTTRQVLLRSAMTLSPDKGGVFATLLGLVRYGLGGRCGDGRQFISWIHEEDFVRAVSWLIEHDVSGPVNVASPAPLPHAEFMRILRKTWGARVGLPANRWMLEVGTFLMRTESELILKSRRVVPGRLIEAGFEFRYPEWENAARELCGRWKKRRTENFCSPRLTPQGICEEPD